jgi:hypothetical protein
MSGLSPAALLIKEDGTPVGTATNPLRVDPTGTTAQPVTDNGASLTIDATSLPLPTGAATAALQTQPGVDIGDVTVNNAAGAAAVNIQDGGNSITVDATALPLPTGAATEATLATRLAEATFTARINTQGQKAMAASTPVVLPSDQSAIPVTTTGGEEATYTVIASATAPANNKSMLSIYNPTGSGYVLKLREFYLRNAATTAVTGVAASLELFRFVSAGAPTGGTALTPISHDSDDAVPAGMDARTGGTVTGEVATPLDRIRMSTDEWGPGTADVESQQQSIANYLPARAKRDGLVKPFFARPGQGLHMKFATNSTAGSLDVIFVFTKV